MVRKAIVSGQFYEAMPEILKKQIGAFDDTSSKISNKTKEKIYGVIVPHAGYMFSGKCASKSYRTIKEQINGKENFVFIILGPYHSGLANSFFSISLEDFETPLGIVKNEKEFAQKLLNKNNEDINKDEQAHLHEHSIEVQLPFLQYYLKDKKFSFVPIVVSTRDFEKCKAFASLLGKNIKKYGRKYNKKFIVIASGDFTHYGPDYDFVPFQHNNKTKDNLYNLDKEAIDYIIKLDSKKFYETASKTTICGLAPILITMKTCKALGAKKAELLEYYTSGDIIKDYKNAVGYASIVFV